MSFNALEWIFNVVFIGPEDVTNKQQDIRKAYSSTGIYSPNSVRSMFQTVPQKNFLMSFSSISSAFPQAQTLARATYFDGQDLSSSRSN